jgi:lysophospholipase L1-like esterase
MAVQTGPKAWIKQLMGRQPNGYLDNVKRAEFNTQLREHYLAAGRLFDIARIEADECCKVNVDGKEVEALNPELTTDGGHLNERGQEVVAAALLNFVSMLPAKQATR